MVQASARPVYILGLSAFYHDAAAALLVDGEVVAAAQEERFSRRKGDPGFPRQAVAYCLSEAGIGLERLDYVVFYEKPWIHFERLLETALAVAPRGLRVYLSALPPWLGQKFFMRRTIQRALGWDGPIHFTEHHEAHMGAAFFPSPFERAAVLTVDGVGEWATTAWGRGQGSHLELGGEIHFPHSLGLLYSAFTAYLGFQVNSGEYKVMGLAPYGEPRYASLIRDELIELRSDGSFRLNLRYFEYPHALRMTGERFARLLGGPPREPDGPLAERHLDIARSLQVVLEEAVLGLVRHVHCQSGEQALALGGGVALNCVANGRLLREGPFASLWIQPAAGDAGSALGAAFVIWHHLVGASRPIPSAPQGEAAGDRQHGSYLGPRFETAAIRAYLDRASVEYEALEPESVAERIAASVAAGRVVGVLKGRMEFGPRALGHRSILGDPRDPTLQRRLNLKIKFRESFRPFAPAVLASHAREYFELDRPSPYMLLVAPVDQSIRLPLASGDEARGLARLQQARSRLPAVTHVDFSARIQTVDGEHSPGFHRILEVLAERTGMPVVVNTSFNVRGEPIVCTPHDALRCFLHTEMDELYLESLRLSKAEHVLPDADDPRLDPAAFGLARTLPASPGPSPRSFGLLLAAVLGVWGCWGGWRGAGWPWAWAAALAGAGCFLLVALGRPAWLARPLAVWMALARIVGRVVGPVLLAVLWIVLIVPLGLVARILGWDPLCRRPPPAHASLWRARRPETRGQERYEQQF